MTNMYKTLALILLAITMSSCEGIFSGIYDDAESADDSSELQYGFNKSSVATATIYLDCTSYMEWIYVDLDGQTTTSYPVPEALSGDWDGKSGWTFQHVDFNPTVYTYQDFLKTDAQQEPDSWHFAIHHFDVRTNGAGVYETSYTSLSDLPKSSDAFKDVEYTYDELTDNQAIVDRSQMLSYYIGYQTISLNRVLTGWATMDFSTPPPVYGASGHVYILKFKDGKYCALLLDDYKNALGTKGYMTMSYIYPY